MGLESFFQIIFDSLMQASVLGLATLGIVLIFKTSFTTNFAQGSIAAFSAYIMYEVMHSIMERFFPNDHASHWWVFVIAMVVAVVSAFILGYFVDTMILRKAKRITSAGKQMITMGLVLILTALTDIIFGVLPKSIDRISYDPVVIQFSNIKLNITVHNAVSIIVAFAVIILLFAALNYTKWGLGVRATASNEVVSSMMGVNTRFITAMSWAIAGSLGALAAALYAPTTGNLSSAFMTSIQVNGFLALILGGAATFWGPVVAAIFIPLASGLIAYFQPVWQPIIVYTLILMLILIKPVGLFGKKITKKV